MQLKHPRLSHVNRSWFGPSIIQRSGDTVGTTRTTSLPLLSFIIQDARFCALDLSPNSITSAAMSLKDGMFALQRMDQTWLLTVSTDAYPSSAAFDQIASALAGDQERQDAIKKGGDIFAFTLKNESGSTESWHIDLKETGKVGKGAAPEGKKAAGMLPGRSRPASVAMTKSPNAQRDRYDC